MEKLISLILTINSMDCNRMEDLKSVLKWIAVYILLTGTFICVMTFILARAVM